MKKSETGVLATELANALPPPAGRDIATAINEAARRSSITGAQRLADEMAHNPVSAMFGTPVYKMPVKIKEWPIDKKSPDPNHTNATVAYVTSPYIGADGKPNGMECEMRVYRNRDIVKKADGRHAQDTYSVSLPKGVKAADASPVVSRYVEQFTDTLLDGYFDWIKTIDESTVMAATSRSKRGRSLAIMLPDED